VNLFLRHRWATWLVLEPEHFPPMLWAFPLPCSDVTGPSRHLTSARRAALAPAVTTAFPVSRRLDSLNVSANLAPIVIDPDLERERSWLLRFSAFQNIDNRVWFFNVIH
jgi:hypothetical protein